MSDVIPFDKGNGSGQEKDHFRHVVFLWTLQKAANQDSQCASAPIQSDFRAHAADSIYEYRVQGNSEFRYQCELCISYLSFTKKIPSEVTVIIYEAT